MSDKIFDINSKPDATTVLNPIEVGYDKSIQTYYNGQTKVTQEKGGTGANSQFTISQAIENNYILSRFTPIIYTRDTIITNPIFEGYPFYRIMGKKILYNVGIRFDTFSGAPNGELRIGGLPYLCGDSAVQGTAWGKRIEITGNQYRASSIYPNAGSGYAFIQFLIATGNQTNGTLWLSNLSNHTSANSMIMEIEFNIRGM